MGVVLKVGRTIFTGSRFSTDMQLKLGAGSSPSCNFPLFLEWDTVLNDKGRGNILRLHFRSAKFAGPFTFKRAVQCTSNQRQFGATMSEHDSARIERRAAQRFLVHQPVCIKPRGEESECWGLIQNLSVSLLGGIQPDLIRKVAADTHDDGLLQRQSPVILRPATVGTDASTTLTRPRPSGPRAGRGDAADRAPRAPAARAAEW